MVAVINSVQGYWTDAFAASGTTYTRGGHGLLQRLDRAPGAARGRAGMGPFYCPADQQVYIDLSFWDELKTNFGANDAPFTQAYVLAHEYGHHVQNLLGTSDRVGAGDRRDLRRRSGSSCRPTATRASGRTTPRPCPDADGEVLITEITDADLQNAHARPPASIGDDYIQTNLAGRGSTRRSSATAPRRSGRSGSCTGYQSGDPASCNTFDTDNLG